MGLIIPIVEGDGEVGAVPNLVNRLIRRRNCYDLFATDRVINAHGVSNLLKAGGVEELVRLAAGRAQCEGILVLLDADEHCAYLLARALALRLRQPAMPKPIVVVAAKCEYEAWFLASLSTIAGVPLDERPGLRRGLSFPEEQIEALRDVKGWLSRSFTGKRIYKETLDQLPLTRLIDLERALPKSRSLRRLDNAIGQLIIYRNRAGFVSPL